MKLAPSQPVNCSMHMLPGAGWRRSIDWSGTSNGGAMDAAIAPRAKWNSALPASCANKLTLRTIEHSASSLGYRDWLTLSSRFYNEGRYHAHDHWQYGQVIASINNLVLALIRQAKFQNAAQARRWFAAHISQAFGLLTLPFSPF